MCVGSCRLAGACFHLYAEPASRASSSARRRGLSSIRGWGFSCSRGGWRRAQPFRDVPEVSAPVIPVPAPDGVLRGGYDTGGFYDEAFEHAPERRDRPARPLRRGDGADRLDGRPRRAARGRAREPLVPAPRRDVHDLLGRRPGRRADPAVRPDPADRVGRRLGRRRGGPAAADRGAQPVRARHLPRPGDPARRHRPASPRSCSRRTSAARSSASTCRTTSTCTSSAAT